MICLASSLKGGIFLHFQDIVDVDLKIAVREMFSQQLVNIILNIFLQHSSINLFMFRHLIICERDDTNVYKTPLTPPYHSYER